MARAVVPAPAGSSGVPALDASSPLVGGSVGHTASPIASPSPASGLPDEVLAASLRARPLHLPKVAPSAPCPKTTKTVNPPGVAPALGDGPIYPVLELGTDGVLHYRQGQVEGGWWYVKVLWVASPDYQGPALIRGYQIDGPQELRYGAGADPASELWFPVETGVGSANTANSWRDLPSYTRLHAPGCYAYQVDGRDLTEVIVFRAEP